MAIIPCWLGRILGSSFRFGSPPKMAIQINLDNLDDHHTMMIRLIVGVAIQLFAVSSKPLRASKQISQSPPPIRVGCLSMCLLRLPMPGSRGSPRFGRLWQMRPTDYMGQSWSLKSTIEMRMAIIPCWLSRVLGWSFRFGSPPQIVIQV